jgi:hypothetical protein
VKFLKLEEYSARLPRRPPPVAANPFPVHGGRLACTLPAACASSRSTCGAAGGVGRALGRPGQRPARAPTPTAWRSGAAGGPWRARACATGTHGKARARGRPAIRSRRPTRSWPRTSALDRGLRIDYVFVRCDDSLHGPTLDVRARILAFAESVGGVWVSDHFGFVAELSVPDVCS